MAQSVFGGHTDGIVGITLRPPAEFIRRQHDEFRARLEDLEPLWDRFKPVLANLEEELFATEDYGAWPPLAESTLRQKAAQGFPPDPLVRTGRLSRSLLNAELAAQTDPQRMSYGTDVEYAHFHQDGGSTPGRPPQRQVLDLKLEGRRRLEQQIVGWLNEVARDTWERT